VIYAEGIIINETNFNFNYFDYNTDTQVENYTGDLLAGSSNSNPDSDIIKSNKNIV